MCHMLSASLCWGSCESSLVAPHVMFGFASRYVALSPKRASRQSITSAVAFTTLPFHEVGPARLRFRCIPFWGGVRLSR